MPAASCRIMPGAQHQPVRDDLGLARAVRAMSGRNSGTEHRIAGFAVDRA